MKIFQQKMMGFSTQIMFLQHILLLKRITRDQVAGRGRAAARSPVRLALVRPHTWCAHVRPATDAFRLQAVADLGLTARDAGARLRPGSPAAAAARRVEGGRICDAYAGEVASRAFLHCFRRFYAVLDSLFMLKHDEFDRGSGRRPTCPPTAGSIRISGYWAAGATISRRRCAFLDLQPTV